MPGDVIHRQATVLWKALLPDLPPPGGEAIPTAHTRQTVASETMTAQLHACQGKLLAPVLPQQSLLETLPGEGGGSSALLGP